MVVGKSSLDNEPWSGSPKILEEAVFLAEIKPNPKLTFRELFKILPYPGSTTSAYEKYW